MTFNSARNKFFITLCIIGLLYLFFDASLWWLVLPGVVYLTLIIYGSAIIQANFYGPAYCYGNTIKKEIALSFDDGPNQEYTPQILSTLANYNALATFFVIGKNIEGNEKILKQIDTEGHSIGNHTYTHSYFVDFKNLQGFIQELNQTEESVFRVIGKRMRLFRPPYGVTTPHLVKASSTLNYNIIGWTVRSFDTTADSLQTITRRIETQIQPGAIVLFHDTSDKTIQALKQTLSFARDNDYKIVGIEQLLAIKAYQ